LVLHYFIFFSEVEKKPKENEVPQGDEHIEEEFIDASSCIGLESNQWYSPIVNILMSTLLIASFILIVAMVIYLLRILYQVSQKKNVYVSASEQN